MSRYEHRGELLVPDRRIHSLDDIIREHSEREYLKKVRRNSTCVLPGMGARPGYTAAGGGPPPAIAFVDSYEAPGTSHTPPGSGGASNVLIVGIAYRSSSTTAPTEPASWTNVLSQATNSRSIRVAIKAHSGSEGSHTWTSASGVAYLLYSNVDLTSMLALAMDYDSSNSTSTTWPLPAKTISAPTSWVCWAAYGNGGTPATPTGNTSRETASAFNCGDTNGPVSSFSSQNPAMGAAQRAIGMSMEILAAP